MNEVITQETALKRQQALSLYEKAKYAVAQYESIDDVKDYMNKAAAVEEYGRRANDRSIENNAGRARLYCLLKMNELIKSMREGDQLYKHDDYKMGGRGHKERPHSKKSLDDLGINRSLYTSLREIDRLPETHIRGLLGNEQDRVFSVSKIYKDYQKHNAESPIPQQAIEYYAQLKQFKKHVLDEVTMSDSLANMTDEMRQESEEILQQMRAWLGGKK